MSSFLFFPLKRFIVEGKSMLPNYEHGSRVIADCKAYKKANPKVGDVVLLMLPNLKKEAIKRVYGIPGDLISSHDGYLLINGIKTEIPAQIDEIKLKNTYYVIGDNSDVSIDSRNFGPLPKSSILGKVWVKYWPIKNSEKIN